MKKIRSFSDIELANYKNLLSHQRNFEQIKIFFDLIDSNSNDQNSESAFINNLSKLLLKCPSILTKTTPIKGHNLTAKHYLNRLIKLTQKHYSSITPMKAENENILTSIEKHIFLFQSFNKNYLAQIDCDSHYAEAAIFSRKITKKHFSISTKMAKNILVRLIKFKNIDTSYIDYVTQGPFFLITKSQSSYSDSFEEMQLWSKHPVVFVNWNNDLTSLFLAAHELGHAVFQMQNKHRPLRSSLQEIPSSLFEIYLADFLVSDDSPFTKKQKELLQIQFQYLFLDRIFGQALLARFTNDLANIKGGESFKKAASKYWYCERKKCFGSEISISINDFHWLLSPHIIRPQQNFYYLNSWLQSIHLSQQCKIPTKNDIEEQKNISTPAQVTEAFNYLAKWSNLPN